MSSNALTNNSPDALDFTPEVPGFFFLAPMAGYTDKAFRRICGDYGAEFCFTEMVSTEAILRDNGRSLKMAEPYEKEDQYGIQLFGSEPAKFADAAEILLKNFRFQVLDINAGCPVPKITKNGAGSALMRTPKLLFDILKACKPVCQSAGIKLSVKIRSGWDENNLTYKEIVSAANDAKVDILTVHPRTRVQGYSGTADHSISTEVVKLSNCPVYLSGDMIETDYIRNTIEATGAAGAALARGAVGRPDIFTALAANKQVKVLHTQLQIMLKHLTYAIHYEGELLACRNFRKHAAAYTKGLPGGPALRKILTACTSYDSYSQLVTDYIDAHHS